jgi:hypothetical protein
VVLATGRATVEVCAKAGQMRVGIGTGDLQVDVLVEQLEALLAGHLESRRAQHPLELVVPTI